MFSFLSSERRVPQDHPLRLIKALTDAVPCDDVQAVRLDVQPGGAVTPDELSLLGFLCHVASAGSVRTLVGGRGAALDSHIRGGAARLCEAIAARLGDRVQLGTAVLAIDHVRGTVRISRGVVRARHIVLAVDPATARAIAHDADVPAERRAAESTYTLGTGIKAHVVYPEPFWRNDGLSGQSLANAGVVRLTFDVTPPDGPGVLATFLGRAAGHDPALLAPGARDDRCARVVADLVDRFGARAAQPLDYVEHSWSAEPHQSGCVPSPAPGVLTAVRNALVHPIGRLHFAGAETSTIWEGHMEGAVRSGDRVAVEIAPGLARG